MGRPRSFNPNTKSGRRNIRQEYQNNYQNKSEQEKANHDNSLAIMGFVLFIVAMIVCFLVIAFGGKIK